MSTQTIKPSFTAKDKKGEWKLHIKVAWLRRIHVCPASKVLVYNNESFDIVYDFPVSSLPDEQYKSKLDMIGSFQKWFNGNSIVVLRRFKDRNSSQKKTG